MIVLEASPAIVIVGILDKNVTALERRMRFVLCIVEGDCTLSIG